MRTTLFALFTALTIATTAQQVKFDGQLVDSIIIQAHHSAYQFDDSGTTKGSAELIFFVFDSAQNQYTISNHYFDEYRRTFRPDTIVIVQEVFDRDIGKKADSKELEFLMNALNSDKTQQQLLNQLEVVRLQKYITPKRIREIARRYEEDWNFDKEYSTKEENKVFFEGCAATDTFQIFVQEELKSEGYIIITDYSNTIDIWIYTAEKKHHFEGKYPNPVKQPWYRYQSNSSIDVKSVTNLDINTALTAMLHKDFLLLETISTEELVNQYITWYLDRQGVIQK